MSDTTELNDKLVSELRELELAEAWEEASSTTDIGRGLYEGR